MPRRPIAGAALLERASAEQHCVIAHKPAESSANLLHLRQHNRALAAVDHAEQVVRPAVAAGPAVAERDERKSGHGLRRRGDVLVGDVPDHHGVGDVAEGAVADDGAEAADHAVRNQPSEPNDHLVLREAEISAKSFVRRWDERQPGFQRRQQLSIDAVHCTHNANPRSM